MSVEAIEKPVDSVQDLPVATLAVGSLVRLTREERGKPKQIMQGELVNISVAHIEQPLRDMNGKYVGYLKHRSPVIHIGGNVILESVNDETVLEEVPDLIFYGHDTGYKLEPVPPVIGIPE